MFLFYFLGIPKTSLIGLTTSRVAIPSASTSSGPSSTSSLSCMFWIYPC